MIAVENQIIRTAYRAALSLLASEEWRGLAGEIARTGEEDPLAMIDDSDLREVVAAKMQLRRSREARMFQELDQSWRDLSELLHSEEVALPRSSVASLQLAEIAFKVRSLIESLAPASLISNDQKIATLFLVSSFCDVAAPFILDAATNETDETP